MPLLARTPWLWRRSIRSINQRLGMAGLAVLLGSCGAGDTPLATEAMRYCASLGQKQPGTAAGAAMADYIESQFQATGLQVSRETFQLPSFMVHEAHVLQLSGASVAQSIPAESLTFGGSGQVESELVFVGSGHPADYAGLDTHDKIVLVKRHVTFHRSAQLKVTLQC